MVLPTQISGDLEVPVTDFVSLAFDKQTAFDEEQPLYIDCEDVSLALSYQTSRSLVRRLVAGLRNAGLQNGDAVMMHLPNSYAYSALFFAIIGAGGIPCGTNPAYQFFELDHLVQLATPRFIFTTEEYMPTVREVCNARQLPENQVYIFDKTTLLESLRQEPSTEPLLPWTAQIPQPLSQLLCHVEENWLTLSDLESMKTTPAAYFSTSGTSGLPKLAVHTHYSLVAQHITTNDANFCHSYPVRRLACLPFFHIFGAATSHAFAPRYGQPIYVMSRFSLPNYAENIHRFAATETSMAPPMVYALLDSGLPLETLLASLRYVSVGGAPLAAGAMQRLRARLNPRATMTMNWGMTEIGPAAMFRYGETDATGSIGRLIPGCEVRLVSLKGEDVTHSGEAGEAHIRSHGLMAGYRGMTPATEGDGFFRTGDVMRITEGKLHIVGRAKELIKVKGWQVAPAELEAVLLTHPDVADCGVVGAMAADGVTEVPRAYVVRRKCLREWEMVSAAAIYEWTRTRLASYKRLEGGVVFVEQIPRTASGKVQRFKLSQAEEYRQCVTSLLRSAAPRPAALRPVALKLDVLRAQKAGVVKRGYARMSPISPIRLAVERSIADSLVC